MKNTGKKLKLSKILNYKNIILSMPIVTFANLKMIYFVMQSTEELHLMRVNIEKICLGQFAYIFFLKFAL